MNSGSRWAHGGCTARGVRLLCVTACMVAAGCASPDIRVKELERQQAKLRTALDERNATISQLNNQVSFLEREVTYYTGRSDVLNQEKDERLQEIRTLRKGVRTFTDEVIHTLQASYQKTETVDYIGAELFRRGQIGSEEDQVLVDLENRIDADGTVIGGRAYMSAAGALRFCLLRPTQEPGKLRVVAMSEEVVAAEPGSASWTFNIPLSARAGDYVGVCCRGPVPIPYDDADTGIVALVPGKPKTHDVISVTKPGGRNRRAYSFGVIGYLGE